MQEGPRSLNGEATIRLGASKMSLRAGRGT